MSERTKIILGKLSGVSFILLSGILLSIAQYFGSDIKTGIFVRDTTYLLFYLAIIVVLLIAIIEFSLAFGLNNKIKGLIQNIKFKNKFSLPGNFWLNLVDFFYSQKIKKQVFEPIIADWQEEFFEALFKKEIWKARWINVRYTYAFLASMWQKSPIGDLIEFVRKFAK